MRHLFTARTWLVLTACFIVYSTTIPWDFSGLPSLDRISWVPGWDARRDRWWSVPDLVQNVVLFMPIGFFGTLARRSASAWRDVAAATGLGFLLSLAVELLQTMSATRDPTATDLVTNTVGSALGAFAAAVYIARLEVGLRRVLRVTVGERPGVLILAAYTAAVALGSLAPFLPTLDVGALRQSVRQFLDHPWGLKPLGALIADGLLFGAIGYLLVAELPSVWPRSGRAGSVRVPRGLVAAALVTAAVGLAALGLELGQLVIIGHSPGLQDAAVGTAAAAFGAVLAVLVPAGGAKPARRLGDLTRQAPALVLGFAVLTPAARALAPFDLEPVGAAVARIDVWQLVPFYALFENINLSTFRNVFEASAFYLPLGYALAVLGVRPRVGFAWCALAGLTLEVLQIPVRGRVFDVTEALYAGLMGLVGAWVLRSLQADSEDALDTLEMSAIRATR